MPNPTKVIIDCSTGEVTEVELTAEEIQQREDDRIAAEAAKAEEEAAKAELLAKKIAICEKLNLTIEEVEALIK